ncbi:MAG TPA: YceD family protein [Gammaproteobacteria bacterium]
MPDLDRLADRGIGLKGEIELKALPRLNDILHADRGSVSADLRFRKRGGWLTVELEYAGTVELTCQRCLEAFRYPVGARVEMALVESAEGSVPEGYEPVVVEGGRLRPADVVEDELIMALPLVPRHAESADCGPLVRALAPNR